MKILKFITVITATALLFIAQSCGERNETKTTSSAEEVEITKMDSTAEKLKEVKTDLEKQTEKVEEAIEKLED